MRRDAMRRAADKATRSGAARRGAVRRFAADSMAMAISQTRRKLRFFMARGLDLEASGWVDAPNDGV
jgi:hypothetical protein